MVRDTGFEPVTPAVSRQCSTTELTARETCSLYGLSWKNQGISSGMRNDCLLGSEAALSGKIGEKGNRPQAGKELGEPVIEEPATSGLELAFPTRSGVQRIVG